jgi:mannose-6-phosphate isomerase class I
MYNPNPVCKVNVQSDIKVGLEEISAYLNQELPEDLILAIEVYPCVSLKIIEDLARSLNPTLLLRADDAFLDPESIQRILHRDVTDDRILGRRTLYRFPDLLDEAKVSDLGLRLDQTGERRVIFGTGASLVTEADMVIYADISRWETTLRYRTKNYANWMTDNAEEDPQRKIKRAYFVEWIMADRLKRSLDFSYQFYLDMNDDEAPKLVETKALREAYKEISQRPFRLRPFFDPGVWGGHWMQETFGIDQHKQNLAWSFDGVPEENSLLIEIGGKVIETPALNLVYAEPVNLLGERVYGRFGAEFPIRFDFLDTVGGQNLSLQVHPRHEYIQNTFGMPYTQDESYYIMYAEEDAYVYAGTITGINREQMIEDLYRAEKGEISFDADKYINRVKVKKHDHVLYPGGTIHCSGKDMVVLEISSTPNRFTFKLWDWDRVDLDGLPRPINLGHGLKNIDWSRDTEFVYDELVNQFMTLDEGPGYMVEKTGLHEREFIETQRYWFKDEIIHEDKGSVRMLNLVEGEKALVQDTEGKYPPLEINYGETFIVPASVKTFRVSAAADRPDPSEIVEGRSYPAGYMATIEASVR